MKRGLVFVAALFASTFLTLAFAFEPPPDHVIFQCDRATEMCTIQKSSFFRTENITLKINEIKYARFDPAGWMIRGDQGLDIKLQIGNHIWIGAGSTFFGRAKEQRKVDEINNFLTNTKLKQISVTDKSFPTALFAAFFLLGGPYSIYKGLRPYFLHVLTRKTSRIQAQHAARQRHALRRVTRAFTCSLSPSPLSLFERHHKK